MDEISCAKMSSKWWKIPLGAEWPQADDYYDQERPTSNAVSRAVVFPAPARSQVWSARTSVAQEVGPWDDDDRGGEGGAFLA
jgi:hypothetical protein